MRSGPTRLSTQFRRVLIIRIAPRLFKVLAILLALTSSAGAADLPRPVEGALLKAGVPHSSVAVFVQEVGATQAELALNAGAAMNPASVMKVVTTYAGLELLGPAFRWKTEAYVDGTGLALKGYGDP